MAEYVAFQPYIKFPVHGNCLTELCCVPKDLRIQNRRKCYKGSGKVTQLPPWNVCKSTGHRLSNLKAGHYHKEGHIKCCCLGTLINTDGTSSDWIPMVDQLLLMASIFLTHMAGVIPFEKSPVTSRETIQNDNVVLEDTFFSGSALENHNEVNLTFAWDTVKDKLMNSLNAIEHGASLEKGISELEQTPGRRPSSLFAVAEAPRFRLLWASFQWLKNEVDNIPTNSSTSGMDNLQLVFTKIIQRSSLSICSAWLKEELCLTNNKFAYADLLSTVLEKLNEYDSVLQNIIKSGKEDLYTELVCVLRFGSLRQDCCYGDSFFTLHGVSVLEDLVVTLAEGIASMYLELISVDSNMSNEMNSLGLSLCTLSTRALQRLRNEVALNQWLYQNMESIVSMYEDRFDLRTLQSQLIEEPNKGETEKFGWLKKIGLKKPVTVVSQLRIVAISCTSVSVKRTKELRVLMGWRYYFSLFLEFADITMPFIRTLFAKVSDAISFFLVCLIGRSLGLIYTGIRQSLRWK